MIRGDRTLAVRLPNYARKEATVMAHSSEDVLTTLRKGRIRYFTTMCPDSKPNAIIDQRRWCLLIKSRSRTLLISSSLVNFRS